MGAISKLKGVIGFLLICFTTTIMAQTENNDAMVMKLYEVYKENGIEEALKVYDKENTNKKYEGMAEPLNILAYKLMQEDKDLEAASKLMQAQIKEYPEEANPYDSYSDVLLEMGDKKAALKNIEKSLNIAENSEHPENNLVQEAGMAKKAMINNKDKQLNFLVGNWDNETYIFQNGKETTSNSSTNNISFDDHGSMLIIDHDDANDEHCCKRILVYNPNKDEFDVSFMRRIEANGINDSKMKIKELSADHYEVIESYTNQENKEVKVKHDIQKNDTNVDWIVYTENEQGWEKVRTMNLKKKG